MALLGIAVLKKALKLRQDMHMGLQQNMGVCGALTNPFKRRDMPMNYKDGVCCYAAIEQKQDQQEVCCCSNGGADMHKSCCAVQSVLLNTFALA